VAARLTLDSNGNTTQVDVWYSVGLINLNGSHAVTQIRAIPGATPTFEMSVAGAGVGYCGAQLKSDNSVVKIVGSTDMGTSCGVTDFVCCNASDVTAVTNCTASVNTFALPALGRLAYTNAGGQLQGASDYPGAGDQVHLAANGQDDTIFGPTTPSI